MAEEQQKDQGAAAQEGQQQLSIQKIYVKDLSFEAPKSPLIFNEKWTPKVDLQLNSAANAVAENLHEVVLTITITTKLDDNVAFLVEVQQAGVFALQGFTQEQLGVVLGSFCPNVLFPYAREAISDIVTRGGFPQLLLAPVNFDALYAEHLRKQREASKH